MDSPLGRWHWVTSFQCSRNKYFEVFTSGKKSFHIQTLKFEIFMSFFFFFLPSKPLCASSNGCSEKWTSSNLVARGTVWLSVCNERSKVGGMPVQLWAWLPPQWALCDLWTLLMTMLLLGTGPCLLEYTATSKNICMGEGPGWRRGWDGRGQSGGKGT